MGQDQGGDALIFNVDSISRWSRARLLNKRRLLGVRTLGVFALAWARPLDSMLLLQPVGALVNPTSGFSHQSFPKRVKKRSAPVEDFSLQSYNGRYQDDDDDDDVAWTGLRPSTQRGEPPLSSSSQQSESKTTSHFFSQKPLTDPSFRLDPENGLFEFLCQRAKIDRPSKIQSMAWPMLIKRQKQSFVIADQTGSGKTLSYLIPLLQRVILSNRTSSNDATGVATPKLLVLAPTAELADQIRAVCVKLSEVEKSNTMSNNKKYSWEKKSLLSTVVLTASGKHSTNIRDQIRLLQQKKNVDVVISTPGRIATILRTKHVSERVLDLSRLEMVVLDEVDVLLLDETFGPQLQTIGEATNSAASSTTTTTASASTVTQFVFVTATLPDTVVAQVEAQFPGTVQIKGPGLHRVAPTVRERLIDVSVPSAMNRDEAACFDVKARALQQALRLNRCKRTLIFCNTVSSCRQVENLLQRMDRKNQIYTVKAYHNAMTADARNENLEFFANAGNGNTSRKTTTIPNRRGESSPADTTSYILVCTDRAARGVDFAAAAVDHVIIFDFPVDPAEYVRRVGRTARAGRDGASTVLAYGWQLPIARSVMGQQQLKDYTVESDKKKNDNGDEYLGGVTRRLSLKEKGQHKSSEEMIGRNIASGRLWIDKKEDN